MRLKSSCKLFELLLLISIVCFVLSVPVLAKEKSEIRIGVNLPITGIMALTGKEHKWAYEQAAADINARGGIFVKEYGKKLPVKLIITDDEGDPGKAAAAVERLIKLEKVDMLLGTHNTIINMPSCGTAEKYKKYYHATAGLLFVYREGHFKWSTMFFLHWNDYKHPYEIMNTIPTSDRPKRVAMLMEDTLDGRGLGGMLRKGAEETGYKFVVDEPWAVGAKDYSSQILKLKLKRADGLILFGSPSDSVTFVRQMKENNFSVKYLHGYKGTWNTDFWDSLGKDAQYILFDGFWHQDYPFPGAKELGAKYQNQFNKPSVSIGMFYATAQILFSAIEKAGTLDGAKVREAVLTYEFTGTVMGDIKYQPDGTAGAPIAAGQWINGEQKLVYPFFKGVSKVEVAPPWNER